MITQHFILHIVPDEVRPRIYLSQRSAGLEKLQFSMVGTNGAYYNIPTGTSVTLVGTKPDKKSFSYACTYSGYTVTCDVTEQMTAVAGIVTAELRFANTSGALLPSQNIEFVIERSPLDGATCSKNDFISIEEEIESISQDAANAKKYAEQAAQAGTTAVASIETAVSTATSTIDSTVSSATSTINSTRDSAVSTMTSAADTAVATVNTTANTAVSNINTKEDEAETAFAAAVEEMREYVQNPMIFEYKTENEALRIVALDPAESGT